MAGSETVHRAPYADDAPRELTDEELSFLSDYTGERDLPALRQHVLSVWRDVKAKARRLAQCARAFVLQLDSSRVASLQQAQSVPGFAELHKRLVVRLSRLSGAQASTYQRQASKRGAPHSRPPELASPFTFNDVAYFSFKTSVTTGRARAVLDVPLYSVLPLFVTQDQRPSVLCFCGRGGPLRARQPAIHGELL